MSYSVKSTFWFTTRRLVLFGLLAERLLVLFFVLFCFLWWCLDATFGTLPALIRRKICLTTNISVSCVFSSYQKWMRTKTVKIVYSKRKNHIDQFTFRYFQPCLNGVVSWMWILRLTRICWSSIFNQVKSMTGRKYHCKEYNECQIWNIFHYDSGK